MADLYRTTRNSLSGNFAAKSSAAFSCAAAIGQRYRRLVRIKLRLSLGLPVDVFPEQQAFALPLESCGCALAAGLSCPAGFACAKVSRRTSPALRSRSLLASCFSSTNGL